MVKIAVIVSHPIQHFCPMYSSWNKLDNVRLKVFFASGIGVKPYRDRDFGLEISWEGIKLDFDHMFLNGGRAIPVSLKIDAPGLEKELSKFSPDVVVIYGYRQKLQRRAFEWCVTEQVPMLMISDAQLRQKRPFWKKIAKRVFEPYHLRKISGFLTVGDSNEIYYRHYGVKDDKFFRSPFPIDKEFYESFWKDKDVVSKRVRDELKIPEKNILILSVGKLVSWKRHLDIIKAVKLIDFRQLPLSVVICGTGPEEGSLRKEAEFLEGHQIILAGFVKPLDLPKFYLTADIYVQSSEQDSHPLVVSEAIFMGCPVIVSDRCGSYGPSDDVRPGVNGFVYRCGDLKALAHFIKKISLDPDLNKRCAYFSRKIGMFSQRLAHEEGLINSLIGMGFVV